MSESTNQRVIVMMEAKENKGPEVQIKSPSGFMLCRTGDYIVKDENGGQWVFTLEALQSIMAGQTWIQGNPNN